MALPATHASPLPRVLPDLILLIQIQALVKLALVLTVKEVEQDRLVAVTALVGSDVVVPATDGGRETTGHVRLCGELRHGAEIGADRKDLCTHC